MKLITWCGRIMLWVAFWPIGLWRSYRHGQKVRQAQVLNEVRRQQGGHPF